MNQEDDDGWAIMRCIRAVQAGQVVYNTYGNLDDAALLCRYGFTLNQQHHDPDDSAPASSCNVLRLPPLVN